MYDLLIIGGGPAGLSAAMTARNRNLTVCVICGGAADSALYKAGHVTNYPGVPDVSGPALLETMTQQARDLGADMLRERALSAMPMGKTFGVSAGKEFVEGRALLLATGIAQRGTFPGETAFLGRGVSYCATCDGMLYRGKRAAVIGGGLFGDQCSPISDTTVLSSTGASCNHVVHVMTQLPYGITVGISAFLGFLFGGLTRQYILSIVVTAVILVVVLFALTQLTKLRYPEKVH